MKVSILNSFYGDKEKDIDTSTDDGRASAKKFVDELIRSGSAVFLEKEVNGETYTYRVTGYDPTSDKLTIRLDSNAGLDGGVELPKKHGRKGPRGKYGRRQATVDSSTGKIVSVAPRAGG